MLSTSKTIAKNTIFLYFRMMLIMLVSLYTSRVILHVLGVDDYGIYQSVGGLVMMLAFVNNALANGTARFLTFEMGTGNQPKLQRTFSTLFWANVGLAVLVFIIAESVGLWFVSNKLVIPIDRLSAAKIAYQFSIISCFFQLIVIPFNACIIAHEKMAVYAYIGIVEVLLKLLICYLLVFDSIDKLVMYSSLLCLVQVGIVLFYVYYCNRKFAECRGYRKVDRAILKDVTSYSAWNLIASTEGALTNQGSTILINLFFSPAVVSARAVANQVNMAANQFVANFRTAANPQIVKKYASQDYVGSKTLLVESTKYSYYLMLLLALPICLVAQDLLEIWLKEVPDYSAPFLQLAIVTSLIQVFDTSFYTALYAKGCMKENALASPTLGILLFPIVYLLFRIGLSPLTWAWAFLILHVILSFLQKPLLLIKLVDYSWKDIYSVFYPCFKVTIASVLIPLLAYHFSDYLFISRWIRFILMVLISITSVTFSVWILGINKELRDKIIGFIIKKKRS